MMAGGALAGAVGCDGCWWLFFETAPESGSDVDHFSRRIPGVPN